MAGLMVGIDNYCLHPKNMKPLEMIKWAHENGAEGVAFSGFAEKAREAFTSSYLRDVRQLADEYGLYLEWGGGQHVPADLETFRKKDIYVSNRRAVGEACGLGVSIIRSCSGGLMRWKKESPSTEFFLKEAARELKRQAPIFRECGITLAIETHFEFTTFELLRLFEMSETEPGDFLGICLDTMNLLTMLEDPVMAASRILPWVVSTHIKDGGIIYRDNSFITFPAAAGTGIIDLASITGMINSTGRNINLTVEDHGGSFTLPVSEKWFIDRFPDLSVLEYEKLYELSEHTEALMSSSALSVTERSHWPSVCEERTRLDIIRLKQIRDSILLADSQHN
jgi:sugar phosphate isomerase/epimerase